MDRKRRKITISVSMSPLLVEKIDKELETEKYASQSDLMSIAVAEHFVKEDLELIDGSIDLFLTTVLSDENYLKKLLDMISDNQKFRISALRRKAKACIELGEFDEALICLNKTKELETGSVKKPELNKNKDISIVNGTIEDENVDF